MTIQKTIFKDLAEMQHLIEIIKNDPLFMEKILISSCKICGNEYQLEHNFEKKVKQWAHFCQPYGDILIKPLEIFNEYKEKYLNQKLLYIKEGEIESASESIVKLFSLKDEMTQEQIRRGLLEMGKKIMVSSLNSILSKLVSAEILTRFKIKDCKKTYTIYKKNNFNFLKVQIPCKK